MIATGANNTTATGSFSGAEDVKTGTEKNDVVSGSGVTSADELPATGLDAVFIVLFALVVA